MARMTDTRRHRRLSVSRREEGVRLDNFISERLGVSRAGAQKLIAEKAVKIDGDFPLKSHHLKLGEAVEVYVPEAAELILLAERLPLNILYEDGDVIALSKEAGMVVHPSPGHYSGTLVNALLAHTKGLSKVGGAERPGIVHRLDMDTSGLMLVAKTDASHRRLAADLKARRITRVYQALVHGRMKEDWGTVDAPIGRHIIHRKKMAVSDSARRHAVTHWRVLERLDDVTLLEVRPETGRTHQIRVHMAHIKHPIVGDRQYGSNRKRDRALGVKRHLLHAVGLKFMHPGLKREMTLSDPLPSDMATVLKALRKQKPSR